MSQEPVKLAGSVLDALALDRLDDLRFTSRPKDGPSRRAYGGTVAGQAVLAASLAAPEDRPIHSAHTYFVAPGDTAAPIEFEVELVRDGRAFSTRRVDARQHGRTIFTMTASFHWDEPGLAHQLADLDGADPDTAPDLEMAFADSPRNLAWARSLFDRFGVEPRFPMPPVRTIVAFGEITDPHQAIWLRSRDPVPGGAREQAACLTYLTDLLLLSVALGPHGYVLGDDSLTLATVSHTVWFHAPLKVDDWFYYDQRSRWAGGARALCGGEILDRAGRLCATTTQEGLLRPRRD